jgi:osmotically-inducible protein OsmY
VINRLEVLPQALFERVVGLPDDGEITQFVRQELDRDPRVGAEAIMLRVTDARVLLWGEVSSPYEKRMAERIARGVIGVLHVENQLQVGGEQDSDENIHRNVADALSTDALLHGQQVDVMVHQGNVTLRGELKDFTSKAQIARLAERVRGVRSVINETKVAAAARLGDDVITGLVAGRLKASPTLRSVANRIQVQTAGGVVTLTGSVETAAQRAEAGRAAFLTDGVRSVDNQLEIVARFIIERPPGKDGQ